MNKETCEICHSRSNGPIYEQKYWSQDYQRESKVFGHLKCLKGLRKFGEIALGSAYGRALKCGND